MKSSNVLLILKIFVTTFRKIRSADEKRRRNTTRKGIAIKNPCTICLKTFPFSFISCCKNKLDKGWIEEGINLKGKKNVLI